MDKSLKPAKSAKNLCFFDKYRFISFPRLSSSPFCQRFLVSDLADEKATAIRRSLFILLSLLALISSKTSFCFLLHDLDSGYHCDYFMNKDNVLYKS